MRHDKLDGKTCAVSLAITTHCFGWEHLPPWTYLSISSGALRMNHALGDAFSVEVGEQVDHVEVLEQQGTIVDTLVLLLALDRITVGSGIDRPRAMLVSRARLVVGNHLGGAMSTVYCKMLW